MEQKKRKILTFLKESFDRKSRKWSNSYQVREIAKRTAQEKFALVSAYIHVPNLVRRTKGEKLVVGFGLREDCHFEIDF